MFKIKDGRTEFYQWDKDRQLIVNDSSIKEVHFCNKTDECSLVKETYQEGEYTLVDVPNVLLQSAWRINVYGYTGDYTKHSATFKVNARTKPEDYVHTEGELKTWDKLDKRTQALAIDTYYQSEDEIDVTGIMLDMPCHLISRVPSLHRTNQQGGKFGVEQIVTPLPQQTKIQLTTDYKQEEIMIEFDEPFYVGDIYWSQGYVRSSYSRADLDVSKLKQRKGQVYVYTTVEEQGWENLLTYSQNRTVSNNLVYTANTTNYSNTFIITDTGEIQINIHSFTSNNEETLLDECKELLEGTYFVYPSSTRQVELHSSFPEVIGKDTDDDMYACIQFFDADNNSIPNAMQHDFTFKQAPQQFIYDEVQKVWDYLSNELEDRLAAIEENL